MKRLIDLRLGLFLAALFIVTVGVPLATTFDPGSPFRVPSYLIPLLGKYLCYALLAVALDLCWGYAGILSLGHGAFFALGGYAMGMHLMREIGARGVYANPDLPDFMVFLGWQELPWFWYGFSSFPFAAVMALAVPGLLAFVFGWFAFRSRVSGVYLSIITQALTFALLLAFFRNEMGFGGNNGLTDFRDVLGYSLSAPSTRIALFVLTGISLAACILIARAITVSKAGKVLVAVRDAESRTRFMGYRVEHYSVFVFTVSAMMAGLAGALYVPQVGIINPGEFAPANSIEIVVWVALGGRGTLVGAAIGALVVVALKSWLTANFPDLWLFALGALFILVTLALPTGLLGLIERLKPRRQPAKEIPGMSAQLYLDGVTRSFDGFKAINGLSLAVEKGELRAVIGPNGAGKTTMMDIITGKTRPDGGEVLWNMDTDLTRMDEASVANLGIGRKFQKPTVFETHNVEDNLRLALKARRGVFASLFHRRSTAEDARVTELLDHIRLSHLRHEDAANLSHGQKQWLEIGMLLAQEPQLLLVDEPAAGMTDAETMETATLLRSIAGERTVIVVEHDMDFVRALECKVTVLHQGSVLAEGSLDHVSAREDVIEVYLGR